MGVTIFLARRLSLSSGGRKSSPAVRVAIAAVALSVLVMMCSIAIVTGFKGEITDKVAGFNSHIVLTPVADSDEPTNLLTLTPSLRDILQQTPFIEDFALQASIPAIFKTPDDFKGVYLKSLSGAGLRNFIGNAITEGEMPDFDADSCRNDVVISRKAASLLNLKAGSDIDTYFITDAVRVRRLHVAAVFDSHFENYDDSFAYCSLGLVQELGNLPPGQGTSLAITVTDFSNVEENPMELRQTLHRAYADELIYRIYDISTARQAGAAYFNWLDLLDMNVIVVLVLMTVVACVTLVSGMLILMVDKIRFIALMSALGASRKRISRIFMLMAARITFYGLLIGDALALVLLLVQQQTHFMPLDAETYYIDFVPVRLSLAAFLILNISVMAIIWITLIIPSRFAGKAAPARTLANE